MALNLVVEQGNLCKNNELKILKNANGNDMYVLQNTLAVSKNYKDKNGNYGTDFIQFVVYGKMAQFLADHTNKGDRVTLKGSWNHRVYKKTDATNGYVDEMLVDEICEWPYKKKEVSNVDAPGEEDPYFMDGLD